MHLVIAPRRTARRTACTRSPPTSRPACLSSFLSLTPPLRAVWPRDRRFPRCSRRDPSTPVPSRASRRASDASRATLYYMKYHCRSLRDYFASVVLGGQRDTLCERTTISIAVWSPSACTRSRVRQLHAFPQPQLDESRQAIDSVSERIEMPPRRCTNPDVPLAACFRW
jgi:hypothetical protein